MLRYLYMERLLPVFFHILIFFPHDNIAKSAKCLEILNVNSQLCTIKVLLFMFCYIVDHNGGVFFVNEALSIEETYTLGNREIS